MTTYRITSEPTGASVTIDGQQKGITPLSVTYRDPFDFAVEVTKTDFKTINDRLTSRGGGQAFKNYVLEGTAPISFVRTMEPTWASVELRSGRTYEQSWDACIDLLTRKFDIEVISKENGYARTAWLYTWTGRMREDYKVRVTLKFATDRTKVEVKSEAQFNTGSGGWVMGSDEALLSTLKTDVMGTVGRVTR